MRLSSNRFNEYETVIQTFVCSPVAVIVACRRVVGTGEPSETAVKNNDNAQTAEEADKTGHTTS